jgi:hypothetical protein
MKVILETCRAHYFDIFVLITLHDYYFETTTVINRLIFFQTLRTKYDNDVLTTGGSPLLLTAARQNKYGVNKYDSDNNSSHDPRVKVS